VNVCRSSTAELRNGAVTTPKLQNNAVVSSKVRNGSLLPADFKPGSLPRGEVGPPGPTGPTGPAAQRARPVPPARPASPDTRSSRRTTPFQPLSSAALQAACPSGKVPLGGVNTANANLHITTSRPETSGWAGRAYNAGGAPLNMTTCAVCATVNP
jgi:hypothetical protein